MGDGALGYQVCASVRNSQSDLCSGGKRIEGLHETSERTQILSVRGQLLFCLEVRDLNPSNKEETRRSMLLKINRRVTSARRILFRTRIPGQTEIVLLVLSR